MIATIFAAALLANSSVDVILQNQLDSPEGRTHFLVESLSPYVARADELNREILALSEEVTRKMAELNEMLPTLDMALMVDADFQQIDAILNAQMLSAEQQKIADRIAQICSNIETSAR